MNELQLFTNEEFGEVRALDIDGNPWFVAADVCRVLGIKNTTDTLKKRLSEDEKTRLKLGLPGGDTNVVNEPGLYRLISASRKPKARNFQRWVYHDVLPSIRKHGVYMTPETIEKVLLNPDFVIKLATELKNEREKYRNDSLRYSRHPQRDAD